jgi:hypothetical protein
MARRRRKADDGRFKWKTIVIPFSTVQFWVNFFIVLGILAVALIIAYFQFLSPKAQARRLIAKVESGFEESIVMGIKELAFEDYRTIQDDLFSSRKQYDNSKYPESLVLAEQASAMLGKAMEKLRSDDYYRKERAASVKFAKGSVEVQQAGSLGWQNAKKGVKLKRGDRIRTRGGSSCVVQFDDGSQLTIKSDSLVLIDELSEDIRTRTKNSAIKLLVSDVEASILRPTARGSRFLIETPGSVAQVKKARMNIRVGKDNQTEYKLISGDVSVNAGGQDVRLNENDVIRLASEGKVVSRGKLLGVPELALPANLYWKVTTGSEIPLGFSWRRVAEAASYRLMVATDRFFTNVVYDNKRLGRTSARVDKLTPGIYYWRVSSIDRKGQESLFSSFRVLRISQDRTPPFMAMSDPIVLAGANSTRLYVAGAVEPGSNMTINGVKTPLAADGTFRVFQGMDPRRSTITIRAVDKAGNVLNQERPVK